jgi:hypothetical protein
VKGMEQGRMEGITETEEKYVKILEEKDKENAEKDKENAELKERLAKLELLLRNEHVE